MLVIPTWEIYGDKTDDFFQFQGLIIIVKSDVSAINQSSLEAICVSFNIKHFSGQLVKYKECYIKLWQAI